MIWLVPGLAAALLGFGLGIGWVLDDHVHRAALTRPPELPEVHRTAAELFAFVDGDPEAVAGAIARGSLPWWSAPELRLAFWRPVTGWAHALDYRLWPERPELMHLHSLAWFLLAIVVLLLLYRRLVPYPAAGLAGLLFAVDQSQALPALWLANRNAVVAVALGAGSLLAHDLWRRGGRRGGAVAGPLLLLAAVLAGEGAVAVGGYLLAYALFLDPAPRRRALLALLPSAVVGFAWALAYAAGGYGAAGSGLYLDPVSDPLRFAAAVAERGPLLLWGWWGMPPAELVSALPRTLHGPYLLVVLACLAVLALLLRPLLRREPAARFFGLGMLLALVPACAAFPSNRLLGFASLGGAGLLALWMADLAAAPGRVRRALLVLLVAVHLVLAPLTIRPMVAQMVQFDASMRALAEGLAELSEGGEPGLGATYLVVASPSSFLSLGSHLVAALVYGWQPRPALLLASTPWETEVRRPDERTLVLRPRGGFLRPPGAPPPAGAEGPLFDPRRFFLLLDRLFRDPEEHPFAAGQRIALGEITLEVLEVEGGRPLAVAARFPEPLESERWHWLAWREGRYVAFPLPPVGGTVSWPGVSAGP